MTGWMAHSGTPWLYIPYALSDYYFVGVRVVVVEVCATALKMILACLLGDVDTHSVVPATYATDGAVEELTTVQTGFSDFKGVFLWVS